MQELRTTLTGWDFRYNRSRRQALQNQAGPIPTIFTSIKHEDGTEEHLELVLMDTNGGPEGMRARIEGRIPPVFRRFCPTGRFTLKPMSGAWVIQVS